MRQAGGIHAQLFQFSTERPSQQKARSADMHLDEHRDRLAARRARLTLSREHISAISARELVSAGYGDVRLGVPMKQMEHVVPPPKVEVSSAMLGRQAERSRGGRHHCRYSRSLRRLSSAIPRREGADTEIISGFSLRKQVDRVRNVESSGKTQDEVEQNK